MKNSFENIQEAWKASKQESKSFLANDKMLKLVIENQKKSKKAHFLNILILSIVCIFISSFFIFIAPMKEWLSRIGIVFMIGGLGLRILIEIFSKLKADKIKYDLSTLLTTNKAVEFYLWRKKIHGPITFLIVAFYSLGVFLLNPEFTNYYSLQRVLIFDMLYVVIIIVLFFVIRVGVLKELKQLKRISNLNIDLKNESNEN